MRIPKFIKKDGTVTDQWKADMVRTSNHGYGTKEEATRAANRMADKEYTGRFYPDWSVRQYSGKWYIFWHT